MDRGRREVQTQIPELNTRGGLCDAAVFVLFLLCCLVFPLAGRVASLDPKRSPVEHETHQTCTHSMQSSLAVPVDSRLPPASYG